MTRVPTAAALLLFAVTACDSDEGPGIVRSEVEPVELAPVYEVPRIGVVGDYGQLGPGLDAVAGLFAEIAPGTVVTLGDNVYPYFALDRAEAAVGRPFGEWIYNPGAPEPLRARGAAAADSTNRFFPAPGNHDYANDQLADYLSYFDLPGNERYFAVEIGEVAFFILDTEAEALLEDQRAWLAEAAEASAASYKVAVLHRPPFSSGLHGDHARFQWAFGDMGIDAVLAGHDHSYQRYRHDGVVYVVNGVGGASPREDCGRRVSAAEQLDVCLDGFYGGLFLEAHDDGLRARMRSAADGYPVVDEWVIPAPE